MTNTLIKIGRQRSVWVPPVYRTITVPRTEIIGDPTWEKEPFRTEQRYKLPDGWSFGAVPTPQGFSLFMRPNKRVVNGILEVWSIMMGGASIVHLYRQAIAAPTRTYLHHAEQLVVPGYWQAQEDVPSWEHGAQSAVPKSAPWAMQFTVPTAEHGVIVGPALDGDTAIDYRQRIVQGFHLRGTEILLWSAQSPPADAPLQMLNPMPTLTPDTVLRLEHDGKMLTWKVDGLPVARAGAVLSGDTEVVMTAGLYGAFDSIATPEFSGQVGVVVRLLATPVVLITAQEREGSARLLATPMLHAHGYSNHLIDTRTPYLQASSRGAWANLVDQRQPVLMAYGLPGVVGYASMRATPYMAAHGYDGGFANLRVQPWVRITAASGRTGPEETGVMLDSIELEPVLERGVLLYEPLGVGARISCTIKRHQPLSTQLRNLDRLHGSRLLYAMLTEHLQVDAPMHSHRLLEGRVMEVLQGQTRMHIGMLLDVQLQEGLEGADALTAGRIADEALLEQLAVQLGVERQALLEALVSELLGVAVLEDLGQPTEVWSVTESGESTSYTDYPFDSFANIGGQYFGASETGLYALEGETDDGLPIEAAINLGERDLGTNAIKSLANAYVTVNSDAPMRMQVTLGGQQYTYMTRGASPDMQTQRFDLGRGLRGHFFGLQLMNTDGADFEVGGIEFVAQESKRRI